MTLMFETLAVFTILYGLEYELIYNGINMLCLISVQTEWYPSAWGKLCVLSV
jgi:hypothetical protein